ncbi:hypothetical protein LWI29_030318 [Acer saccharum]|uniref:Uncharacterized protein n=1 Tax=Acer saccharum TaxID=4024 RepID=A0AA39VIE0_ACESA|nr:hypothetical protein LWI29_030318 [Acer saccharum]
MPLSSGLITIPVKWGDNDDAIKYSKRRNGRDALLLRVMFVFLALCSWAILVRWLAPCYALPGAIALVLAPSCALPGAIVLVLLVLRNFRGCFE